ncbi:uncharacterized protein LOC116213607 [Punica granatum]|uniref:Uncharacterized protein LOC116213607 n=1 Tax=Punica granatum TaxID=22663 RepID=A0A6P8EGC0_PUNGR|nr:uncharacterized protein LOC116213607 [Punica granatum]
MKFLRVVPLSSSDRFSFLPPSFFVSSPSPIAPMSRVSEYVQSLSPPRPPPTIFTALENPKKMKRSREQEEGKPCEICGDIGLREWIVTCSQYIACMFHFRRIGKFGFVNHAKPKIKLIYQDMIQKERPSQVAHQTSLQ